ncbi:MAG TPA: hypothetical protein VFU02_25185 [Polyangiaceae bacterium]|nr:hypothetical protein [Polyangiaceae bacterium]
MFSINIDPSTIKLGLAMSLLLFSGCSGDGTRAQEPVGKVEMNLVGQAPSGNFYRLRSALVYVDGPEASVLFDTESNPDQPSLSATVPAGDYTSFLEPGWHLERLNVEGTAQPVEAELLSPNPDTFAVTEDRNTQVALRFRAGEDEVVINDGSFDIVLDVEEAQNPLSDCPSPEAGPYRDCGWSMAAGFEGVSCTPGQDVVVGCGCSGGGVCEGDPMIRVCEGSGACSAASSIALVDDACSLCPETFFICPVSGIYTVLVASFSSPSTFACEPVTTP